LIQGGVGRSKRAVIGRRNVPENSSNRIPKGSTDVRHPPFFASHGKGRLLFAGGCPLYEPLWRPSGVATDWVASGRFNGHNRIEGRFNRSTKQCMAAAERSNCAGTPHNDANIESAPAESRYSNIARTAHDFRAC
jgi:hypothetical protein